jgi:vitamin B12 transporter
MFPVSTARPVALAAACLLSALPAISQTTLEPVLVTGTRQALRVDQALADTSVLDRADIEAFAGRTLIDLLAAQPGLQITNNGGIGRNSGVFLRGLEARHVLLLVDGVRYGSATAGTPSWDNLPLEAIERIEIVRGPLSALYGSDAVGGVVQIFTRVGSAGLAPHAVASVGSHGQRLLGAGLRGGAGSVRYAFALQRQEDEGYSATHPGAPFGNHNPDRDGFEQDSANGQLAWTITPGWELKAVGLFSKAELQIDDGPGADARAGLRSAVASLQLAGQLSSGWRSSVRIARAEDGYETLASASSWTDLGEIATTSTQLAWENQIATPIGSLLLLAERNSQKVGKPGQNYALLERRITGLAAGLQGEADGHHWQLALRRDRNSQFGSQNNGSVGYGYDVNAQLRLSAQLGTSFMAPSFNQLYWPSFGNPKLEPEEGQHKELGLRWTQGGHRVQLAWFEHRIRGYITGGAAPVNLPRTRIEGISLVWDYSADDWGLSASIDAVDPRNATTASAQFDRLLPRRAREVWRLSADRRFGAFTVAAQLRQVGDRFDDAANNTRLTGFTLLDLRGDWQLAPAWKLGLKLNNAADRNYSTANGYNQPGREWFMTLRYSPS